MRERAGWVLFGILVVVAGVGFVREGVRPEHLWAEEGWRRFALFALVLAGWLWRGSGAALVVALAGYGVLRVGLVAVAAPLYLLGSYWLTGCLLAPRARGWMALLLGMGAWIFGVSLAVHLPVNTPAVYFVLAAIPYALGWRRIRPALPEWGRGEALLLFLLAAHFVISLKPETGADALAVHMVAPALVAHDGFWGYDYQRFAWALMPLGADWLFTPGYLLGGEAGARLLNFGVLVALAGLLRETVARYAGPERAGLAAGLFVSTPLVQLVTGSLFVENVWAAMVVGAVVAAVDGELIWAGALLGTALAVKVGSAAFLVPVVAVLIGAGKGRREWAAFAALVVLLAAPVYGNAWWKTGNPVYPFLNHIFRAPTFDTERPFGENRFREPLRWSTPYGLTFRSQDYYEGEAGGMGFQYLLLVLPAAVWARERRLRILLAVSVSAGGLLYLSQPNIRYLYPVLALVSVPLAAVPSGWVLGGVLALNTVFLPAAGYAHRDFVLWTKAEEADYIEKGFPQRTLIAELNARAPGERVAFFGGNAVLGLWGYAYTDQWHSYPYSRRLEGWGTARELREELRRLGVRYVIAPADGRTKYPAANALLRPLLETPVRRSGRFALFLLPETVGAEALVDGVQDSPGEAFQFHGAWSHNAEFPEALGGTLSYSDQAGSTAEFRFVGTGVELIYTRAFNRGVAVVLVDGVERGRVNQYGAETAWRQVWRLEELKKGEHRLEVRVAGNGFVDIDGVRVLGN